MHAFIDQSSETIRHWLNDKGLFDALKARMNQPLVPLPDNFTKPTRMPWGGTKIIGKYKQGLSIREEKRYPIVGESWEISADPLAPSQFVFDLGGDSVLIDFIQLLDLFPEQILGNAVARKFDGQNPILVKLLDAADHLSVQVHPSDDYSGLRSDESGKPESWYILEAEQGCGLYLGLKPGVSKDRLRQAIEQEEDVSEYLNFVEVKPGDFFVIDAGTIHAIGAGVTLIEPQKIAPKKSGKTYRLWDWNRKYDVQGQKDPHGMPRELHIEDSFQVIDFDGLRGEDFITHIQPEQRIVQQHGKSVETILAETENFGVSQLELQEQQPLTGVCSSSFHGFILYAGRLEIYQNEQQLATVSCGQSVVLPSSLGEYTLLGQEAKAVKVYYPEQPTTR